MRKRANGLAIVSALAVAVLVSNTFLSQANSAVLKCKRDTISSNDRNRLKGSAETSLNDLEVDWGGVWYCRNFGSALAWFKTEPVLQGDGSLLWTNARCSRNWRQWSCDLTEARSIRPEIESTSGKVSMVAEIPIHMRVETAESLISESYSILRDSITVEQACTEFPRASEQLDQLKSGFDSEDTELLIRISIENEAAYVARGDSFLQFQKIEGDTESVRFKYRCWSFWIIVA